MPTCGTKQIEGCDSLKQARFRWAPLTFDELKKTGSWKPVEISFEVAAKVIDQARLTLLRDEKCVPGFETARLGDFQVYHPFRSSTIWFTSGFLWPKEIIEGHAKNTGKHTEHKFDIYLMIDRAKALRLDEPIDVLDGGKIKSFSAGDILVYKQNGQLLLWGSDPAFKATLKWLQ